MARQVGLARVSTDLQDLTMQRVALQRAGCDVVIEHEGSSVSEEWKRERDKVLATLKPGDVITVWKFDRLGRNLIDLVTTVEGLINRGVMVLSLTEGLDLRTPMGQFAFRILAAAADFERQLIIERTTAARRTAIEAGEVVRGWRLYGYERDGVTQVPAEAIVVQEVVRRVRAGESIHSLVDDLNARQIPTATGGPWRRYGLRELLRNPRLAGLHSYRGKVIGPGNWQPIISAEDHDAMLERLPRFTGKGTGGGAPVRYAYSGVLTCAVCGTGKMTGNSRGKGMVRYGCGNPHCHKVSISAELLERDLNIAVVLKLCDAGFVEKIAKMAGDDPTLRAKLVEDRQLLIKLAGQFGNGNFTEPEWLAMRAPIERRIRAAEERLAASPNQALVASLDCFKHYGHMTIDELERLEDAGEELGTPLAAWLAMPAEDRRAILRMIVASGVVLPATNGKTSRGTRPMRVSVTFK